MHSEFDVAANPQRSTKSMEHMKTTTNRSGQTKFGLVVAAVVIGLVVLFGSIFTVNERELAVVLQFGQPVKKITEPGLYFKMPFVQEVRRLPRTKQFWRSEREGDAGGSACKRRQEDRGFGVGDLEDHRP